MNKAKLRSGDWYFFLFLFAELYNSLLIFNLDKIPE